MKKHLIDMLRRINVLKMKKTTTNWYVEKDKSWNLAAAIWYYKMGNFRVVQFSQYFADSPKPGKLKSTKYFPSLTNRLFTFIQNNNCVSFVFINTVIHRLTNVVYRSSYMYRSHERSTVTQYTAWTSEKDNGFITLKHTWSFIQIWTSDCQYVFTYFC